MILPPGGFLIFGLAIGLVNLLTNRQVLAAGCGAKEAGCEGCGGHCGLHTAEKEGQS